MVNEDDDYLARLRNLADPQHPSYVGSEADAEAIRRVVGEIERLRTFQPEPYDFTPSPRLRWRPR